jgi:putative peptidoglycan lipid II flippase
VASVLAAYAFGMFVYLGRDVLVRVFYALGDSQTPFKISVVNIFLNALFDYLLVARFGVPGVVLATVGVNIISMFALTYCLDRRLNGVKWQGWVFPILGLGGASMLAGSLSWWLWMQVVQWIPGENFFTFGVQLAMPGLVGLVVFVAIALQLRIPEVQLFLDKFTQRFRKPA